MGHLSTHVLDTTRGRPGAGIRVLVQRIHGERRETVGTAITNADGRCDKALLEGAAFAVGEYEIQFAVGAYLAAAESDSATENGSKNSTGGGTTPRFLDTVVIRFGVSNANEHYHVPLLISPYAYSTYRGS